MTDDPALPGGPAHALAARIAAAVGLRPARPAGGPGSPILPCDPADHGPDWQGEWSWCENRGRAVDEAGVALFAADDGRPVVALHAGNTAVVLEADPDGWRAVAYDRGASLPVPAPFWPDATAGRAFSRADDATDGLLTAALERAGQGEQARRLRAAARAVGC